MNTIDNSSIDQAQPKAKNSAVKKAVLATLIVSLAASPIVAEAHGHGGGGGWWFPALLGGALLYDITRPNYYNPPETVYVQPAPVYYQQPVYVQPPQQVYVQPAPTYQQAPPPAAAAQTWYYCASAKGYYPYIQVCPGGWQQVPATPPAAMQDVSPR